MLSNKLAFAALAVGCLGAAAGGGYLATRQNAVPVPASAQVQPAPVAAPASAPPRADSAAQPVQETEALVGDTASHPAVPPAAPAQPSRSASSKRPDAPSKSATAAGRQEMKAARHDVPPPLTSTWPSSAAGSTPQQPTPAPGDTQMRPEERIALEQSRVPEPPATPAPPPHMAEEVVVSAQTVIGLQTETRLSTETARVEDRVDARVTRDVRVGDRVAIPAGSRAIGSVMLVERGGKFKEAARLGVRFNTIVLEDGTRIPISTETIFRDGPSPSNSSAAKLGGAAVGGAILGAILGGAKGAAIGATAGAGGGAAAVMAGERSSATIPAGTPMTVRVLQPVTVTIDRN